MIAITISANPRNTPAACRASVRSLTSRPSMKQQHQDSEVTIGLDLGDRRHRFCVPDSRGEVLEEGSFLNDRASLARLTARYRGALAVMEAGAHSPWVSAESLTGCVRQRPS
jgi:hypothetical protein